MFSLLTDVEEARFNQSINVSSTRPVTCSKRLNSLSFSRVFRMQRLTESIDSCQR